MSLLNDSRAYHGQMMQMLEVIDPFVQRNQVVTLTDLYIYNKPVCLVIVNMDQWVGSQRTIAVKAYYKNGDCLTAARREFRRHYNLGRHDRVPSCKAIKSWVENFKKTGSALKKKPPGAQRTQRTPQNIKAVRTSFEKSPRRSVT
ncbi:hypothetical protein QTP88_022160 [Uroleucon formosanum]